MIRGITKKCTGVAGRAEIEVNVAGGNPVILDVITLSQTHMKLPPNIRLIYGYRYFDGGTIRLHATDDNGAPFEIQLNQHLLSGSTAPGRLFYNGTLVGVRSDCENALLRILETAKIQIEEGATPVNDSNYIGPPVETIQAAIESHIHSINHLRTSIIDFVRSDRYIEISKHGVQP